jgi:NADH dehydrogenase
MDLLVPLMSLLPFAPLTKDQYVMLKGGNTAPLSPQVLALVPCPTPLEEVLPGYLRC